MHAATLFVPFIGLISPIAARYYGSNSFSYYANLPHAKLTCSANDNNAVPSWAANPAWAENMTTCLNTMNNDGWNGAECKPALADGTALGPSFGFYKGGDKWDGTDADGNTDTGSSCFGVCQDCLMTGIGYNQAVTTACEYEHYTGDGLTRHHCDMGFTYNT